MDGKEKKEGKEKVTKTAAAANSVRALSMITLSVLMHKILQIGSVVMMSKRKSRNQLKVTTDHLKLSL